MTVRTRIEKLRQSMPSPQPKPKCGKKPRTQHDTLCETEQQAYAEALELYETASENLVEATSLLSTAETTYNTAYTNYMLATALVNQTQWELDQCLNG